MKCVECRYRVPRSAGNSGFECGIKLPRGYENIGGNPYVPDHWGCDLGKPKDPTSASPEPEAEITDADRLHWVMNNATTDMMNQFVRHVLTVGGVGDIDDCRTFLDPKIRKSRAAAAGKDDWPEKATIRLRWTGPGYFRDDLNEAGWGKRDASGRIVSIHSGIELDMSQWAIVEER